MTANWVYWCFLGKGDFPVWSHCAMSIWGWEYLISCLNPQYLNMWGAHWRPWLNIRPWLLLLLGTWAEEKLTFAMLLLFRKWIVLFLKLCSSRMFKPCPFHWRQCFSLEECGLPECLEIAICHSRLGSSGRCFASGSKWGQCYLLCSLVTWIKILMLERQLA